MYYDLEASRLASARPPPPFRVDFVTGCEVGACGGAAGPEAHPLSALYFCDSCSRVVSRRDLTEDVDSYYCPNCLENMPSSEAMLYSMRCSKCWECPVCGSTLTMSVVGPPSEQTYYLACSYCRWSSRERFEAPQPEQLIAKIIALEREGEPRQRMSTLVEAFRSRAQEQQRERELALRLRRRSSRGSFTSSSLGAYAARRFSSAMMLRTPRLSLSPSALRGAAAADGPETECGGGLWRLDNLEMKLAEQANSAKNLRSEALAAASAAASPTLAEPEQLPARTSQRKSVSAGSAAGASAAGVPDVPVLAGLTVEELVAVHTQPGTGGRAPLLKEMQRSLEEDVDRGTAAIASLPQRLLQVSYGYSQGVAASTVPGTLRTASGQLEAPLQHAATWALLPVRKPLLTKRSRRCRMPRRSGAELPPPAHLQPAALLSSGPPATIPEEEEEGTTAPTVGVAVQSPEAAAAAAAALRSSTQSAASSVQHLDGGTCGSVVVKPQINPCSNPPFQKNNVAVSFVPRCVPWAWALSAEASQPAARGLRPGEAAELVFTMSNPLDADVEFHLNPRAFNAAAAGAAEDAAAAGTALEPLPSFEQNVEVLTKPFETAISRFQDLADVHEVWGEETERMKALKAQDDADIIPDRKLHKILVRLRFRGLASGDDTAATAGRELRPWVFFCRATLLFADASSTQHEVKLVMRFSADSVPGPVPGGSALLGEGAGGRTAVSVCSVSSLG